MSELKKKKLPYFSDVVLFKRVDKYLDDNIDKRMIDKDEMVEELRNTYKEYQRRNRTAFRMAVFKAYNMINQNILEVTQERSQDGSDVEAIDDQSQDSISAEREIQPTPAALNMMQTYLQGLNSMTSPSVAQRPAKSSNSNNELINISSDEGEEEPPAKRPAHSPTVVQRTPSRGRHHQHNDHHSHHQQALHAHQHPRQEYGNPRAQAMQLINNALPDLDVSSSHHQHQHQNSKDEDQRRKKSKSRNAYPTVSIFPTSKKKMPAIPDTVPDIKYCDFGGYPKVLETVSDIVLHFYQSSIYSQLGVTPPRGFLLHGPPGCGKTLLAHAVAGELNLPLVKVSGPELIGGISGESEERIRKVFGVAKQQVPCILFIDEIDVISQTRENARKDMERRVVSQLIACLDDLNTCDEGDDLIVIGATNRVEELDPGLRRAGRFDKEVCIGIPDRHSRVGILKVLCHLLKLSPDVSIEKIAELTPGFVAADLKSLISDAAIAAVKRIFLQRSSKPAKSKPTIINEVPIKIADDDKSDDSLMVVDESDKIVVPENAEKLSEGNGDTPAEVDKSKEPSADKEEPKKEAAEGADEDKTGSTDKKDEAGNISEGKKLEDEKMDEGDTSVQVDKNAEGDKTGDAEKPAEGEKTGDAEKPAEGEKTGDAEKPADSESRAEEKMSAPSESGTEAGKPSEPEKNASEKPSEKPVEEEEKSSAMEVDGESPDGIESPAEEVVAVESEVVVENGIDNDDKSESEDACVIVEDDGKKPEEEDPAVHLKQMARSLSRAEHSTVVQIEMDDLIAALKTTQPSAKREGFATVPDVTWDDIGSLKDVRNELTMSIMMPVQYPEEFKRMGIDAPSGIMLWGPPGCGKTLLAKAIANESNINFISVKGPELLNMYVGESEKAVRTCFARARNSKPCVIFFDEIDALCPRRSDSSEGSVSSRVVNQVLTEMDGVEGREGVFLMAASNRPDMVDPAVLRPGRLDKVVKVGLPKPQDRVDILKAITKNGTKPPLDGSVDLEKIGASSECEGYSGADLSALVKEASVLALTEHLTRKKDKTSGTEETSIGRLFVAERHFHSALKKIKPSVLAEERLRYEMMEKLYASS